MLNNRRLLAFAFSGVLVMGAATTLQAATFHAIDVNEVYTNADGSIQFVELLAFFSGQTNLAPTHIEASNADGSVTTTVFNFVASFPQLGLNETVLIATPDFEAASGFAPDFVMPAGSLISFPDGRVTFDRDTGLPVDAVAYGNYTGDNGVFGTPAAALPSDGCNSLTRISSSNNNALGFAVQLNSPTRNDGTTTTLVGCLNDCSGNGVCNVCSCECDQGWTGADCSTPTCDGVSNCSGNGTCVAPDSCACDAGWTGGDCATPTCDGVNNCSGNGTCVAPNTCTCDVGWSGSDCATPTCGGVNNCSGNGTCIAPDSCACDVGWFGTDCATPTCDGVSNCSGNGTCVAPDTCDCDPEWTGPDCSISNVPTVSQWGIILLTSLLLTAGTIVFRRRGQTGVRAR